MKYRIPFIVLLLAGCSSTLPVRPMGDYLALRGECRVNSTYPVSFAPLIYPAEALKNKQEGWVVLRFNLLDGKAKNIEVLDSSPKGIFENAAIMNLSSSRYREDINTTGCISKRQFKIKDKQIENG